MTDKNKSVHQKHSYFFVAAVLVVVAAIWGINPPVMKLGLVYLSPVAYNAARMVIAAIVSLIALALSKSYRSFQKRDYIPLMMVSIFGFFLFQLFFTVGVQRTTAGNASFILSLLPVSVVIINRIFRIEKITKPVIVGILFSLIGIACIILGSGKELSISDKHISGALFILIAQVGYGYYTVFSRPLLQRYSTYQITAAIITISTILFVAVSAPSVLSVSWKAVPLKAWISVSYSGIFALCIGNFIWIWGTGVIGSMRASVFNNLSPVFAVLTGYILLGETFGPLQIAGATGIFIAIWITRNREKLSGKRETFRK
jgi:drug/metabolite transporter (DMT)-like permease